MSGAGIGGLFVSPNNAGVTFAFGHAEQERIEVDVHGYERAPVGEYCEPEGSDLNI